MDSLMDDQFIVPPVRGTGLDGISKREDSTHVYYDVPIEGLKRRTSTSRWAMARSP